MGETTKTQKTSWFKGMKAEFKKIIRPDQKSLTKQTIAVVSVSCFGSYYQNTGYAHDLWD